MNLTGKILFVLFILSSGISFASEEAEDVFFSLYGERMKKAQSSSSFEDDILLAAEFLECARSSEDKPELFFLFCNKAYELSRKDPSGHLTAVVAMEMVYSKDPEKKQEALQNCVDLFQEEYRRARGQDKTKAGRMLINALLKISEVQDSKEALGTLKHALGVSRFLDSYKRDTLQKCLDAILERQKVEEKADFLEKQLLENPANSKVREKLVLLFLLDMDNTERASKLTDESLSKQLQKYIFAATKPLKEAPELACLEMGRWYDSLSEKAETSSGKATALWRAKEYYERFLSLHQEKDLLETKANLALKKICNSLQRMGPKGQVAGFAPWLNLMKGINPSRHSLLGKWAKNRVLVVASSPSSSLLAAPVSPPESYEVKVVFQRTEGKGQAGLLLPVGNKALGVVLDGFDGWGHGIEKVYATDDEGFRGGEWVHTGKLKNKEEYSLDVKVEKKGEDVKVTVTLDDKEINRWEGKISTIRPPEWKQSRNVLALHAWNAQIVFSEFKLKKLSREETGKLSEIMKQEKTQ